MSPGLEPMVRLRISDRFVGLGVLALTVLVYALSLSGDWVWDDVFQYRDNPAITRPWILVTNDIWGPTGYAPPNAMPVYRPLAMLSHVPGQILWRGPTIERFVNLGLHLGICAGVAGLVVALGACRRAAWFGAACLALHPAATESVAWVSARGDLIGSALVLIGMVLVRRDRPFWSGLCFALAPFCKETFVVAPVALVLWMLTLRKSSWLAPALSIAGVAAFFVARAALGIEIPSALAADGAWSLIGAVGAVAARGTELLLVPTAPDVMPSFESYPILGVLAIAVGCAAVAVVRGRPVVGLLVAPLPFVALAVPASQANGLVADRYFYVAWVGCAAAAGFGYEALQARRSWAPWLFAIPLLLAPVASARAADWQSNRDLFAAALARHPDNSEALFQVAYDLHVTEEDCDAAIPLYRRAMKGSARADNNLQACLLTVGRFDEAATLGPELARSDPASATPALNTARALTKLGRIDEAMPWVVEALRREPGTKRGHVLLGQLLGERGLYEDALGSFERALEIAPDDPEAVRGLHLAQYQLSLAARARGEAPH